MPSPHYLIRLTPLYRRPELLPLLKPEYVAKKIVHAIRTNKEMVMLPRFTQLAPFVRALCPVSIQDEMNVWLGSS